MCHLSLIKVFINCAAIRMSSVCAFIGTPTPNQSGINHYGKSHK